MMPRPDFPSWSIGRRPGEEVVISRHGKAVAKLVGYAPKRAKRRLGILRGKIKFHKGWDKPLPEDIFDVFKDRD